MLSFLPWMPFASHKKNKRPHPSHLTLNRFINGGQPHHSAVHPCNPFA